MAEVLAGIQEEEGKWKKAKILTERAAYQEDITRSLGHGQGQERSSSSYPPTEEDAVAMDTGSVTPRRGGCVRYIEVIENMEVPVIVDSFRTRVDQIKIIPGANGEAADDHRQSTDDPKQW